MYSIYDRLLFFGYSYMFFGDDHYPLCRRLPSLQHSHLSLSFNLYLVKSPIDVFRSPLCSESTMVIVRLVL